MPILSQPSAAMAILDPEIRSEVSRLKGSQKESRIIDATFDEGRFALISGIGRHHCRSRNPARRNVWERGRLESERERAEEKPATRQKQLAPKGNALTKVCP